MRQYIIAILIGLGVAFIQPEMWRMIAGIVCFTFAAFLLYDKTEKVVEIIYQKEANETGASG